MCEGASGWILLALGAATALLSPIAFAGEAVPRGVAARPWDGKLGNHRARVAVGAAAEAVRVHLPWRRRDGSPEAKAVLVLEAATGGRVADVVAIRIGREAGDVVFEAARAGEYHVYYMPFAVRGGAFPTTVYTKPEQTADPAWLARHGLTADALARGEWRALPEARAVAFEARTDFDRMDPMEVIASAEEVDRLLAARPGRAILLFPESRERPIRMTRDIPERWAKGGPAPELRGEAMRGEFYAFQIGVWAARADVRALAVRFSDLRPAGRGRPIPASALRCINTGGKNWLGRPFAKEVSVPKGGVQALWCGVDVPADAAPGDYSGTVTVEAAGAAPAPVRLALAVGPDFLTDHGDGDLPRMSRLRWLDSTVGLEEEVTSPYTPVEVAGRGAVSCLGRRVTFDDHCLPRSVRVGGEEVLAGPVGFTVETAAGAAVLRARPPRIARRTPARVVLESSASGDGLSLASRADMEFDGYVNFQLSLRAERDVDLADCRLEVPLRREFATYMMGMGRKGGFRPERWDWKWDPARHQDSLWVGDAKGGIQLKLKGPDYRWPLVNIHYHRRPLLMPEAWHNAGKGGCAVEPERDGRVVVRAFGGPRRLAAGQELRFDFAMLVTPVKPLDPKAHWRQRYFHASYGGRPPAPEDIARTGARVVNIHHGNDLNPYINYPFLTREELAAYVARAHELGLKVKLYYTIRELTNHTAEIFALRSLGREIYADGPGGGYAWLVEHLVDGYSPAWHHRFGDGTWCASISQTGLSRWHNYYLEGLGWLVREVGIDGLYLDEIGYDREIMKRVRRVLDRSRPGCLLDLHSWNHLNGRAGFANCLNLYLEHMPYLDSLWIGEGRNYDEPPDHWMVEISGIPFGLMGEMLQGGGNPWRGMLYGMTNRLPWSGDPRPVWKLWDDFGIAESEMLGYWEDACPVRTGRDDVIATAYVKKGRAALIVIASWAAAPVDCSLEIDWKALSLDPARAKLHAPEIANLQGEDLFEPGEPIPVEPRRGWMFVLDETPRALAASADADVYAGRKVLLDEPFTGEGVPEKWRAELSARPGTAVRASQGELVITSTANSCALVERALPPGAGLVECELNSGDDGGQTWGLGLGLVWPRGFLRIHLRAEDGRFGFDDGREPDCRFGPAARPGTWQRVRFRIERDKVLLEGLDTGARRARWRRIGEFDRKGFPGDPVAVRIGKMHHRGTNADHPMAGRTGTCRAQALRVLGPAAGGGAR